METTRSFHYDQTPIKKVETMPNGALRLFGTVANTGWLTYHSPGGDSHREYVSDDVLFEENHLNSIAGGVLTNDHPDEEVTPENYKQYAVGSVGSKIMVKPQEGLVDVVIVVNDKDAIEAVNSGKKGLSMGYWATTKPRQDGGFDQTSRIANHVAIVDRPRANKAFLQVDSWTGELIKTEQPEKKEDNLIVVPQWKILSVTL